MSPNDHATTDEREIARAAGYKAFEANQPRAPFSSEAIRELIGDTEVGAIRTRELFMAYTDGFDEAADEWIRKAKII